MGEFVGRPLPEQLLTSSVRTRDDAAIDLASTVKPRPTALIFIRHFGCLGCSVHMAELAPRMEELHKLGLEVVLVGNGEPHYIDGFMDRFGLSEKLVTVVTDPSLKTHKAAMLRRSFWGTFGLKGIWDQMRALMSGHRQPRVEGDNWQQGGAILVDKHGVVVYYHRNETLGDHAPTTQLVDVIYKLLLDEDPLYN